MVIKRKFGENIENKVYEIEQPTQCKLKFNIPISMVNEINSMLKEDHEVAGVINFDKNNNITNMKTEKGNADSVYTPNNVINFHTHPISAYNNGHTVWGWPSGEDIRETIKFSLAGNKAHLVFSNEGLYTIQVSPCKIRKMKELLDDKERGILIFIIEEYFKTTHNFRGVKEVNNLDKKDISLNPYSYVDFINNFDLVNLLNAKKIIHNSTKTEETKNIGHTGIHSSENDNINKYGMGNTKFSKIPNVGFPDVDGTKIVNAPIKDYIQKDDLKEIRKITQKGEENDFKVKDTQTVIDFLTEILKKFDAKPCNITWNHNKNAWFFVNFFPSNNYRKEGYISGDKFITPDKMIPVTTDIEPFIRIFSDKKEGCTINDIAQSNKFKIGKMSKGGSGCKHCGFGKNNNVKNKNKIKAYKMPRLNKFSLKTLRKDLRKVSGGKSVRRHTRFGDRGNYKELTDTFKEYFENDFEKSCTNLRQSYNQKEIDLCNSEKQKIKNDADTYKNNNKLIINNITNQINSFKERIRNDINGGKHVAYKSPSSTKLYDEITNFLKSIDKNINNDNYKIAYLNKEIYDLKKYINNYDVLLSIRLGVYRDFEHLVTPSDYNQWLSHEYYVVKRNKEEYSFI